MQYLIFYESLEEYQYSFNLFEDVVDEIDSHADKYTLDGIQGLKDLQRDDETDFTNSNNSSMVGSQMIGNQSFSEGEDPGNMKRDQTVVFQGEGSQ